ncbi:MAG TPA: hypothetical protein VMI31_06340 [Fimbriimonadaceae bacterium]|nr:hypothetical protein [Fimbriimonadaceae bacterium]
MKHRTEMDEREVDMRLAAPGQIQVREAVQALPEETVSLAWRSELNVRLRQTAARKRRLDLYGWIWKPTAGLAVAGALAVALFVHPGVGGSAGNGALERGLVNQYIETTTAREIAADGMTPNEAKDSSDSSSNPFDWDQEDVGATL